MSMRLAITGRQVEITPGIRQLIEKRLAKLERGPAPAGAPANADA